MVYLLRILSHLVLGTARGQVSSTAIENYLHSLSRLGLQRLPQGLTSAGVVQNAFQRFLSQVATPSTFPLYLIAVVDQKVPPI